MKKKRYLLRNFYAHLALAHLNIKLKMCTMNEVKATVQQKSFRNISIHTITRNCELNERKKREDRWEEEEDKTLRMYTSQSRTALINFWSISLCVQRERVCVFDSVCPAVRSPFLALYLAHKIWINSDPAMCAMIFLLDSLHSLPHTSTFCISLFSDLLFIRLEIKFVRNMHRMAWYSHSLISQR